MKLFITPGGHKLANKKLKIKFFYVNETTDLKKTVFEFAPLTTQISSQFIFGSFVISILVCMHKFFFCTGLIRRKIRKKKKRGILRN